MKTFKDFREEAKPVEKPSKDKATANHPAEDGIEGDVTPLSREVLKTPNSLICVR